MAATSHDFWLKNLSARTWKNLHMLVYPAYALLVGHVALGAMQAESSAVYPVLLGLGITVVGGLHLVAGRKEMQKEASALAPVSSQRWVDIGSVDEIRPGRAKVVCLKARERIARLQETQRHLCGFERVCAPGRAARRRQDRGRVHHLPVARLPIPAPQRSITAAVHEKIPTYRFEWRGGAS